MKLNLYQVDAFTDRIFKGNPAAVCPLDEWLPDELMQQIAMENNLAETAFVVKQDYNYQIRWFTPTVEVDLCGHATLAAAFVLFHFENHTGNTISFHSHRSGPLTVSKSGDWLTLNFPADVLTEIPITNQIKSCFSTPPAMAFSGRTDYVIVFNSQQEIQQLTPDFEKISQLAARGVAVTAKGSDVDFVSRFFGPQVGINEDPVTGSAHTSLIPYWTKVLCKQEMTARQLSAREGFLKCKYLNDRVEISGNCRLFLKGEIYLD